MRTLFFLLQKEFIQLGRDKSILLILFMITLIMLFIVPPAAKVEVSEIALSVVDHDRTTTSRSFLRKLTSADQFVVGAYVDSYEEALAVLEKNQASGILEIPKGFEKHLMEGSVAPVMLEIDAVNGVTAGLTSFYFLQIVAQYIWEYIDNIGFQQGFKIASQEEIMAQVEAQAQAELMKRAKAEQAAQAELSHKQTLANAQLEAEQERDGGGDGRRRAHATNADASGGAASGCPGAIGPGAGGDGPKLVDRGFAACAGIVGSGNRFGGQDS